MSITKEWIAVFRGIELPIGASGSSIAVWAALARDTLDDLTALVALFSAFRTVHNGGGP